LGLTDVFLVSLVGIVWVLALLFSRVPRHLLVGMAGALCFWAVGSSELLVWSTQPMVLCVFVLLEWMVSGAGRLRVGPLRVGQLGLVLCQGHFRSGQCLERVILRQSVLLLGSLR